MKDDPHAPQHRYEHATPTVIHQHEDETLLARWLRQGLAKGPRFWMLLGGVGLAALVLMTIVGGLTQGQSEDAQAWVELMKARTTDAQVEVAEAHPTSPASRWAKLQAATELFSGALYELPPGGDVSKPKADLKRAHDLFAEVEKGATDDRLKRLAAFGAARALEARNELPQAIEKYREIAKQWPEAPEGQRAVQLARELQDPSAATFYQQLYAYKAAPATLPDLPKTGGTLDLPPGVTTPLNTGTGTSPLTNPLGPAPSIPAGSPLTDLPLPPSAPTVPPTPAPIPAPTAPDVSVEDLPENPFSPAPSGKAQETTPKPEAAPAASPSEKSEGRLPADPFAPAAGDAPKV